MGYIFCKVAIDKFRQLPFKIRNAFKMRDEDYVKMFNKYFSFIISNKNFFLTSFFLSIFGVIIIINFSVHYRGVMCICYLVFLSLAILVGGTGVWLMLSSAIVIYRLTRKPVKIDLFHIDRKGGLKPISSMMLLWGVFYAIEQVPYYAGLLSYPTVKFSSVKLILYIMLGISIIHVPIYFLFPQWRLHKIMIMAKENELRKIKRSLSVIYNLLHSKISSRKFENSENISSTLSSLNMLNDSVERFGTWPFDIKSLVQLFTSMIPIIATFIHFFREVFP